MRGRDVPAATLRVVLGRRLSPRHFRILTGASVVALIFIIVTGAGVRLTGSGLGCPDWPTCAANRVVAPWRFHAWVEFGNRLVTGAVSIAVVLAVLGALVRAPRRRDLTLLSLGLVAGLVAEIVLGGLTVRHHLAPGFVMGHFLLAAAFLADAVVLHHRAGFDDDPLPTRAGRVPWAGPGTPGRARPAGPAVPVVSTEHRIMGALLVVAATIVVCLGAVTTSTGPHGGDPSAQRFPFSLHDVAQLHGTSVEVFLVFTVAFLWSLARSGAPPEVLRRAEVLLVVLVAQGAIGYIQYFSGVPAALVEVHVAGAVAVIVAVLRVDLALTRRPSAAPTPTAAPVLAAATVDRPAAVPVSVSVP